MNAPAAEEKPKAPIIKFLFRQISRLANLVWWLLLAVLVLAALFAGLGRQITQNINDYRPELEQLLSERLQQDVQIGSLSARWSWLNPTLVARDLVLKPGEDSEEVIGSLQSLRVGLDFIASLVRFRIVFSDFEANGLELVINQTPRGDIEVEGADLPEPLANDLEEWIDLAGQWLSDPSVRITRVSLGLRDATGQLRQLEIPQLDLVYRRGMFHASGRAMRPGTTEQLASFRLVGQHFFRGDFTGQFYGDINSGRLFDGLAQEYAWRGIRAEGFDIGGQIWLTFRDGFMEQASGHLKTPYLQLGAGQVSLAPLENIEARFGWRRKGEGPENAAQADNLEPTPWYKTGEFHLNELSWRWNGTAVPGFDLRFQSGQAASLLVADGLPIGPVRGLFSSLDILPQSITRALANYRPSGILNRLLLKVPVNAGDQFRLTADLRSIDVAAFGGAPTVRGLDGTLIVNKRGGLVQADSTALTFGFPSLFKGLWDLRNFRASVAWKFEDEVTRVYSDDVAMDFGQSSRLTGAFDLKMVSGGEDLLGLRVGVENGNADMLAEFVPVHLVDPGLYNWLTTAIEKADIVRGTYFGHGRIGSDTPPGSFVSSMVYDFKNSTVQYDERWPKVTEAAGSVFIHEGNTRIDLASGQTGGLELRPAQVRVMPAPEVAGDAAGDEGRDDPSGSTMVYVNTAASVTGDALAYWMKRSPLGDMAGSASDSFVVDGQFYLDLELGFALDSGQPPDVRVMVRSESGSLAFTAAGLRWTDVSGELSYSTNTGFSSAPLRARFLDNPVSVRFGRGDSGEGLILRQEGGVSVETLRKQFELIGSTSLGISGRLDYTAMLEVSEGKDAVIHLASDMAGVAVDWPDPLGKPTATRAPLDLTIEPGRAKGIGLKVDWQERMNLDISLQSEWVNMVVNDLRLGDRRFQGVDIEAVRAPENWLITVAGEWIRGMITWPGGKGPVTVDLEKLYLKRNDDQSRESDAPPEASVEAFRELGFENWPDVSVRIADLRINDEDAGIWSLEIKPEASRFVVENIEGKLNSLILSGALNWRLVNDEVRTGFEGKLSGGSLADIGALVAVEVAFKNKKTVVELDLDWPGRPDQFTVADLSGNASVRFDSGVILEGNSTAQLFRIFNLLNSDTLWRRLKLDFSDLYEAGVAFDAISGKANLDKGVLTLDPELQIVGPSGAFKFSGTTDMADETLDMNMVVVLPLTQNLPLAAILLGAGAPIGGALFVLDKVLGDPLSKLTSATYRVGGSWDNPKVELKRVFGGDN